MNLVFAFAELIFVIAVCCLVAFALLAVTWLISSVFSFSFVLTALVLFIVAVIATIISVD